MVISFIRKFKPWSLLTGVNQCFSFIADFLKYAFHRRVTFITYFIPSAKLSLMTGVIKNTNTGWGNQGVHVTIGYDISMTQV